MIPRIIHQFSGASGDYSNVTPDYLGPDCGGLVLSQFRLNANGNKVKGLDTVISGLPAIPSGYSRYYRARAVINADLAYQQYANRFGWYINYNAGQRWDCIMQENGSSSCQCALYYWNGASSEHLAQGGGLNMYFGTYYCMMTVVENDDYLYMLGQAGPSRAFYNCRSYMASRYNKAITECRLIAGWGTQTDWTEITDFSIWDIKTI